MEEVGEEEEEEEERNTGEQRTEQLSFLRLFHDLFLDAAAAALLEFAAPVCFSRENTRPFFSFPFDAWTWSRERERDGRREWSLYLANPDRASGINRVPASVEFSRGLGLDNARRIPERCIEFDIPKILSVNRIFIRGGR